MTRNEILEKWQWLIDLLSQTDRWGLTEFEHWLTLKESDTKKFYTNNVRYYISIGGFWKLRILDKSKEPSFYSGLDDKKIISHMSLKEKWILNKFVKQTVKSIKLSNKNKETKSDDDRMKEMRDFAETIK